jgi:hypothetical protein
METFNLDFLANLSTVVYASLYLAVVATVTIYCIVNYQDLFVDKITNKLSGTRISVNLVNMLSILATFTYINTNLKTLSPTDLIMILASAVSLASGSRYIASKS